MLAGLLPLAAMAYTIDTDQYFAYAAVPRPSARHAQELVMLSRDTCPAKTPGRMTGRAIFHDDIYGETPACWVKHSDGGATVCLATAEIVGTNCHRLPAAAFIDTSTLPKRSRL